MRCAPVVVFAYNRPVHLRETLDALDASLLAPQSDLWIFADGPKEQEAWPIIAEVRAVIADFESRSRFRSIKVIASPANLGLARSVIGGVGRVLESNDRVIVVEDDLLVSPDFLEFMNECLEFFASDASVGSISASCPLAKLPPGGGDVLSVPRSCSHGWATWADRWREVDWEARDAGRLLSEPPLRRAFNRAGADRFDRLVRQLDGRIDSWSIRFGLWHLLAGKRTIYSAANRVRNIGHDGSGTHAGHRSNGTDVAQSVAVPWRLENPTENPAVVDAFHRHYSGSLGTKFRRLIRYVHLRVFGREWIR